MKKSSIPALRASASGPIRQDTGNQAELIEERNSLGFTVDDFNRLVLPIQRYAAFVHLLPASESHHHRGAGGIPAWEAK
jgi:conjugal transfer pilus assembly protein TraI